MIQHYIFGSYLKQKIPACIIAYLDNKKLRNYTNIIFWYTCGLPVSFIISKELIIVYNAGLIVFDMICDGLQCNLKRAKCFSYVFSK